MSSTGFKKMTGVTETPIDRDKLSVTAYEYPRLSKREGGYAAVKQKFGPLAATDEDRKIKSKKDEKFVLNPMSRERLSIEEEEKRYIEQRVQEAVRDAVTRAEEEGRKKGYIDGLALGKEESHREFSEKAEESLKAFEALVNEAETAKAEIFRINERYLVDMIFRIAKMVLLKDLSADREYVTRLAKTLIERVGVRDNIRLRVSRLDLEAISGLREGLEKTFGALKNLQIEPTDQLDRGGLQLETDWNLIDAGIEQQLEGIRESLMGNAPNEAPQ